jgi:hypothetical protein
MVTKRELGVALGPTALASPLANTHFYMALGLADAANARSSSCCAQALTSADGAPRSASHSANSASMTIPGSSRDAMYDDTERASPRSTAAFIVSIRSSGSAIEI